MAAAKSPEESALRAARGQRIHGNEHGLSPPTNRQEERNVGTKRKGRFDDDAGNRRFGLDDGIVEGQFDDPIEPSIPTYPPSPPRTMPTTGFDYEGGCNNTVLTPPPEWPLNKHQGRWVSRGINEVENNPRFQAGTPEFGQLQQYMMTLVQATMPRPIAPAPSESNKAKTGAASNMCTPGMPPSFNPQHRPVAPLRPQDEPSRDQYLQSSINASTAGGQGAPRNLASAQNSDPANPDVVQSSTTPPPPARNDNQGQQNQRPAIPSPRSVPLAPQWSVTFPPFGRGFRTTLPPQHPPRLPVPSPVINMLSPEQRARLRTDATLASRKVPFVIQEDVDKKHGVGDHELTFADVLFGRGGLSNSHPGNVYFRNLVDEYRLAYAVAKKGTKTHVAKKVVQLIRSTHGRFLKKDEEDDMWYEVGDEKAVEKAGQNLREGMARLARETPIMPYPAQLPNGAGRPSLAGAHNSNPRSVDTLPPSGVALKAAGNDQAGQGQPAKRQRT